RPGLSDAERLGLDRAVAEVQGATGLMVRWQVIGPIPPESTAALVARVGRPFEPPGEGLSLGRTLFPTGTDGRLRSQGGGAPAPGSACLGVSDFALPEAATAQLLASGNGTLRIWADGKLVHQRAEAQPFQPDSDRVPVELGPGPHRLAIEL